MGSPCRARPRLRRQSEKSHGAGISWFAKAKGDTVLQEYVLYWRAQANRAAKRNSDAFADLQKILTDFPNTATKEQVLELFAPTAREMGRPQAAVDALNSYQRPQ